MLLIWFQISWNHLDAKKSGEKYVVYFSREKKSKNHNNNKKNKQHLFSLKKISLLLLDGILIITFCSMQLFKMKKNTTNSANIVIETSGLFLYCFFSSNHRPPCIKKHPNLEDVFFLSEKNILIIINSTNPP